MLELYNSQIKLTTHIKLLLYIKKKIQVDICLQKKKKKVKK